MRYAVILAGGSGTRLWPWSRSTLPKQLLPLVRGQTLLQLAYDRLDGLVRAEHRFVCAGQVHHQAICSGLGLPAPQFLGEPTGRDTAAAIGLCAAILYRTDPDAAMAISTADHLIEPVEAFRATVAEGLALAEQHPEALVTFGVAPTAASTAYGYLELGEPVQGEARIVRRFREKPDAVTAEAFFAAGPQRYLWNSGLFVWRAATLLDCLRRYEPEMYASLTRMADAWNSPHRDEVLADGYPALKKISVDYAVMERASADPLVRVLALPLSLDWADVGSWNAFATICPHDEQGNALGAGRHLLHHTSGTLVASSDPNHLIATVGCDDLLIIHTADATLVCRASEAERIKELYALVGQKFGPPLV